MASTAVLAAVKARLAANWTAAPVVYPNEDFDPPADNTPFVQVDFPIATAEKIGVGPLFRDDGTIRFVVNVPKGWGLDHANDLAGQLATLFRDEKFGGVNTDAPTPPVYLGDDGAWAAVSTSVPYHYHLTGA